MGTSRRGEFEDALEGIEERWEASDDTHNLTSRERIRRQLEADIEAFIARGGQIQHLDTTAHADNYVEQVGDTDFF